MKFATVATGGVGGWLAVKLAAAGEDVGCIARGAHLAAIRERGLTLRDGGAETMAHPRVASDDAADIGPVDAVLVAVKAQDLDGVAPAIAPLLGPETVVIPFLNGVEASSRLAAALPGAAVLEGTCGISMVVAEPGVIEKGAPFAWFRFAERDGARSDRALAAAAAMQAAGIDAEVPADIHVALWRKFMMLATLSGITAAARCTAGDIAASPELTRLAADSVAEVAALARARGVAIAAADEAATTRAIAGLPPGMRASQANDLLAGRPLEVDWLSGAVARLSGEAGLDAPVHRALHALLVPVREGRRR